ncbi:hypothetical protein C9J12_25590 [Photobacterium frigidiphilum]|uniref:TraD/TraG TraM recognition site domain-containing protein n=1 Tax=Photobacterium frigidiphilum TaxID=264736 RepID=A0A2T3J7T1_9GAMM|nr:TraM recognition domain-containing protein [Photobacterium frigidiphilum]PSU44774.1 hypothetical protein C9J12_25590 [Photobacterium frigidiphilum]
MMDNIYNWSVLLTNIENNINPWITLFSFIALSVSGWISLMGIVDSKDEKKGIDVFLEHFRQRVFIAVILLHFLGLLGLSLLAKIVYPERDAFFYLNIIIDEYTTTWEMFWFNFLILFILSVTFIFFSHRIVKPQYQSFIRRYTIKKSVEKQSDIRDEILELNSTDFIPSDYYKDGVFFFGLNEDQEPIYVPDDEFKSKHAKILGPSQTGKGVGLGVLIDQAIRKGWGVWFNDLKPDDFIYQIMLQACNDTNRSIKYLDLNGSFGTYEPFQHGTIRQREERIKRACKILDAGDMADHYKSGNRSVLDYVMPLWDGTLTHLSTLLHGNGIPDDKKEWVMVVGSTLRDRVTEFLKLDALKASTNRTQFTIPELMDNGDVVYVMGNTADDLVRSANLILLDEFISYGLSKKQNQQIFMVLDEVRFLVSDKLANSLATLLSKHINMAISYQARNDLANSPDKTLNVGSISNGIETNTLLTMSYRGHDEETAQWISGMTGTQLKTITKMESAELDRFGTESWTGNKTYGQQEEYLIPTNRVLSFNKRVGAFINAGELATIIKTCWIPVKEFMPYPTEPSPIFEIDKPALNNEPVEDEGDAQQEQEDNRQEHADNDDKAAELMKLMENNL